MKRIYSSPSFEKHNLQLVDCVCSSGAEEFSSYIAPPDDWGSLSLIQMMTSFGKKR